MFSSLKHCLLQCMLDEKSKLSLRGALEDLAQAVWQ